MKKKIEICILAAMVSMASCSNKDEDADYEGEGITEMTAIINDLNGTELKTYYVSNEDGTKYSCKWSQGDSYMFTDGSVVAEFSNKNSGENVGSFSLVNGESPSKKVGATYYAYYPSTGYSSYSDGTFTVTLPPTQTYKKDSVLKGVCPLLGIAKRSDETSGVVTNFYNLATFVIVKVKSNAGDNKVKSIVLSAKESLSGAATASFEAEDTPVLNMASSSEPSSVTLNCGDGVAINDQNKTFFYIAIPYGDFHDFTIKVNCEKGSPIVSNKGDVSFKRSVYRGTSVYFDITVASGGTGTDKDVID